MNTKDIANSQELKAEIARLKAASHEQGLEIKTRFKNPKAIVQTIGSLLPATTDAIGNTRPGYLHPDLLKLASRFLIPFALNKTIFRNSNFLIKMVVDLVSQKAANQVTTAGTEKLIGEGRSVLTNLWRKLEPLIRTKSP
jgi:hypothetical protein